MKVAILNISIGKYDVFWEDFYRTAEKNFLPKEDKHYFVFTDNNDLYGSNLENVSIIYQKNLGWPFNTMKRFEMFKRITEKLNKYDYVFFINGNALFMKELTSDFIKINKNIITIIHPGLYGKKIDDMPYERNPKSRSFIPKGKGKFYVQGAFIGGKSKAFVELINSLDNATTEDLKDGIIAIWHDESFLNRYILDKDDIQVMGRQYLYYEEYKFPWEPVIMLRNKRIFGDLSAFRGGKKGENIIIVIKQKVKNIKDSFLVKLHIVPFLHYKDKNGDYIDIDLNDIDTERSI